jgi:DNA-binding SARP family transcriptional activator
MLELRLFGGFHLSGAGLATEGITAEKGFLAVLAVVAAAGDKGISRDVLSALLWPESDTKRARGSLKQAVYSLRHAISPELFIGRAVLRLNPAVIGSDVARFYEAFNQGRLEEAVDLYHGDFLAGFNGVHSFEFERWLDRKRSEFALQYRTALDKLWAAADRDGNADAKQRWLSRLVEHDLLDVNAVLRLVDTLRGLGQIARALQYATRHANAIESELESAPDERITEIICCLRQRTSKSDALRNVEDQKRDRSSNIELSREGSPATVPSHERLKVWGKRAAIGITAAALVLVLGPPSQSMRPVGVTLGRFIDLSSDGSGDEYAGAAREWVGNTLRSEGLLDSLSFDQTNLVSASTTAAVALKSPTVVSGQVEVLGDTVTLTGQITEFGTVVRSVGPIRVPRTGITCGVRVLGVELAMSLGRPLGARSFPMMSLPHAQSPWRQYCELYGYLVGIRRMAVGSAGDIPFNPKALSEDSTFLFPFLPIAQVLLEHDGIGAASRYLGKVDHHRAQLDPLNRVWLDYLIGEVNGDAAFRLRAAQRGAEMAPQSFWSLVTADMLVRSDRPQDAKRYIDRLSPDLSWMRWDERQQDRYWWVRLQIAHRLGDEIERSELARAARIAPFLPSVRIAAALQHGLSGREVEMNEILKKLLTEADSSREAFTSTFGRGSQSRESIQTRPDEAYPRREHLAHLIAELECHGKESAAAKALVDRPFATRDSEIEADRRFRVFADMERGRWYASQYRLRKLLQDFPKSEFRSAYVGRLMFVNAVMRDTAEALQLADSVASSPSVDGAMAYWITATNAWVRRSHLDSSLIRKAIIAGYDRTLSRHSRAVDVRAFWSAAPRPLAKLPVRCITETDPSWKSLRNYGELNPR